LSLARQAWPIGAALAASSFESTTLCVRAPGTSKGTYVRLRLSGLQIHSAQQILEAHVVNRADIGMIQSGSSLSFASKSFQSLVVFRKLLRQELEVSSAL
jgi:hypothetical protein